MQWEALQRPARLLDARASRTAFPRWSVGTSNRNLPIDITTVPQGDNEHAQMLILNGTDDAIIAYPITPKTAKRAGERFTA